MARHKVRKEKLKKAGVKIVFDAPTRKPLIPPKMKLSPDQIRVLADHFYTLAKNAQPGIPTSRLRDQCKKAREEGLAVAARAVSITEWLDKNEKEGVFERSDRGLCIPPQFFEDPPIRLQVPESRYLAETLTAGKRVCKDKVTKESFSEGISALNEEWDGHLKGMDIGPISGKMSLHHDKPLVLTHEEEGVKAEIEMGIPHIKFICDYWKQLDPSSCIRVRFAAGNLSKKCRPRFTTKLAHPHVDEKGKLCLGHTKAALNVALMTGDFLSAVDMVMSVLENYSDQDPFLPLFPNWTNIPQGGRGRGCIQCSTQGTTYYCEHPEHGMNYRMCGTCGRVCARCGRPFCSRHTVSCGCGQNFICDDCFKNYKPYNVMCDTCGYVAADMFKAFPGEKFPSESQSSTVTSIPNEWGRDRTTLTLVPKEKKSDKEARPIAEPVP